jgi:hypothetical protein
LQPNKLKIKIMSFNGNEGAFIALADASAQTKAYRTANPGAIKAHYVGVKKLNDVLSQTGCVGIRIYYAINPSGTKEIMIVGVDANENDITTLVLDHTLPCPSWCGNANSLNS